MWRAGSAVAVLFAFGLIAACEDASVEVEEPAAISPPGQAPMTLPPENDEGPPRAYEQPGQTPPGQAPMTLPPENDEGPPRAYEQPGQTPPGQAPMAEPWERPAEEMDPERQ
jgi:hypothetical protein